MFKEEVTLNDFNYGWLQPTVNKSVHSWALAQKSWQIKLVD